MAEPRTNRIFRDRMTLLTIGALAGVAAFVLVEVLPVRIKNERLLLLIAAATGVFFTSFLAATGPLRYPRAAIAAALLAIPASGMLFWASFRFDEVGAFLQTAHPTLAFMAMVVILLPFLIARLRPGAAWLSYPELFTQSWNILVRYAAACLFAAVFWVVLFVSDALFGLVGLNIIQDVLNVDWVPYVLTGAVLGLGLAVVVELSDYLSPFLILRLLRLLLPVVLVVTVVFLAALPVQGLSGLLGGLSSAATLLVMAAGIATLVSSAVDCSDDAAAEAPIMRAAAQLLAIAMPVLAVLSIYAIWLRVKDYGWSPDRLAAATVGVLMLGYGLLYLRAVLLRGNWMARIRAANIVMALTTAAVAGAWLSPLINAQRLSANNQLARFARGDVSAEKLDLWFIGRELGVAGEAAIAVLKAADQPQSAVLQERLARLEDATSAYNFDTPADSFDRDASVAAWRDMMAVRPAGRVLAKDTFNGTPASTLRRIGRGCGRVSPAGNPGCVMVLADFMARTPGDEGIVIYMSSETGATLEAIWPGLPAPPFSEPLFMGATGWSNVTPDTIDLIIAGAFSLKPTEIIALEVTGAQIILKP